MSTTSLVKQWISIVIHPSEMEKLQQTIVDKLYHQVCGKCMDNVGYVDDVEKIVKIHDDHISPRTGSATFNVLCVLKVIQVSEGDIKEAIVTTLIHDKGLYADVNPITFFAKWHPDMVNLYEGNACKIKILRYRLDGDKIRCIGEYISPNPTKKNRKTNTGNSVRKTTKRRRTSEGDEGDEDENASNFEESEEQVSSGENEDREDREDDDEDDE